MTASQPPLATAPNDWPGKGLGLAESGPRSIARLGRRFAALLVDWLPAYLVSHAFFGANVWVTLAIFAALQILFISLLSGSIGHLILGMRVVPVAGGWVGFGRPVLRTLLLCIVIPAVIWDRDQRGMHDRISGTILVRR
ncbi:MAG: RDD family protein [Lacisediminihabitans sp.]